GPPEGPAAVVGDRKVPPRQVDPVGVLRIDRDPREIERPEVDRADPLPGVAAIVAAEQPAALRVVVADPRAGAAAVALDHRVHDARILREEGEPDAARARRQAVRQLPPRTAGVVGTEDSPLVAVAAERPRRAPARVHPG